MFDAMTRYLAWDKYVLSILRVMAGLLFMEHGTAILFGFPPGGLEAAFPKVLWFASVIECFGGALITLGLFTRPVAFLLSGEMAIGYFRVHATRGFFPVLNGGDAAILFCFLYLYMAFAGGGAWSVDRLLLRNRK